MNKVDYMKPAKAIGPALNMRMFFVCLLVSQFCFVLLCFFFFASF